MKLHTERNDVERGGVAVETAFRIKTTAKAFDILSSGLYTDPKLAVVRELSCNAYDAHVAAGNANSPFEIHLPNKLEPWFHVRDFGTGLDDDDVMNLYTTYFESTKADSNNFIGALGLGSKSPFSYTKAFEVISRFSGKQRMYSVFINEDGIPSIARLGEVKTKEGNGLEVRITIQKEDFSAFYEKTAQALRWFPLKPNVIGSPQEFKFNQVPAVRLEGTGWKLFDTGFVSDFSRMTAVQGNVAYKVDISKLGLKDSDVKLLQNSHLVGFFEIGDLEVAANREEIRYDDRSKAALVQKIADMRVGVLESVEKQVNEIANKPYWDIIIELNSIATKIFGDRTLFKQFVNGTSNEILKKYLSSGNELRLSPLRGHTITGYQQTYSNGGRAVSRKHVGAAINPEPNVVVFYNDLPSGGIARVMQYVRQHRDNFSNHRQVLAIVIRPEKEYEEVTYDKDENDGTTIATKRTWTEADFLKELKQLHDELGNVSLLQTSKDAPVPPRSVAQKTDLPIFQYSGVSGRYKRYVDWKRTASIDLEAGGLYFSLQNGAHIAFTDKTGELRPVNWGVDNIGTNLAEAVRLINGHLDTEYTISDVYGFGSQAINKIKKNEAWVNMFDVLREVTKTHVETEKHFAMLDRTPDVHGIKSKVLKTTRGKFFDLVRGLKKSSTFRKAVEPLIEGHETCMKLTNTIKFVRQINIDLQLGLFDNKGSGYYGDKAFQEYPMFKFINNIDYSINDRDIDVLFEYINLIDRS